MIETRNLRIKTVNRQSCTVRETMLTDNLLGREREREKSVLFNDAVSYEDYNTRNE
jgi:hypothetical protein